MPDTTSHHIYSRTQKVILLVLICVFAAGLAVLKHRRLASADGLTVSHGDASAYSLKVDLNTATLEELALLPDVGEKKARAILSERDKNGPFKSLDDLARVPGIGPKTIQQLSRFAVAGKPDE